MHIILGGTGHVGSAVARALLARGEPVTIVGHDPGKAAGWEAAGARFAAVDATHPDALRAVLRTGTTAYLLNPPADPKTDTDAAERASAAAIVAALDGSGLARVVGHSTYGAQPGEALGDLSVLHDFEQALHAQPIPAAIVRAAYYFTNWDAQLPAARDGTIVTPFPADLALPMVSPADLGREGARLLTAAEISAAPTFVEGPRRYTVRDVGDAFAAALGRPVAVEVVPQPGWEAMFGAIGFSPAAARAYARMTAATIEGVGDWPQAPVRGATTLEAHIAALVAG